MRWWNDPILDQLGVGSGDAGTGSPRSWLAKGMPLGRAGRGNHGSEGTDAGRTHRTGSHGRQHVAPLARRRPHGRRLRADTGTVDGLVDDKARDRGAASLEDLVAKLTTPAPVADGAGRGGGRELGGAPAPGRRRHRRRRRQLLLPRRHPAPEELAGRSLHYLDCGTSGGVWGLERGYCLMIGGRGGGGAGSIRSSGRWPRAWPRRRARRAGRARRTGGAGLSPLRAQRGGALRQDGAQRDRVRPDGGLRGGPQHPPARGRRLRPREADAETTPLREPELYQYTLDLPAVAEVWRRGSVIASWLLDLTAGVPAEPRSRRLLRPSPTRARGAGPSSPRSTSVPAPVLSAALFDRFRSRGEADFADRLLSAMRYRFGGHAEKGG